MPRLLKWRWLFLAPLAAFLGGCAGFAGAGYGPAPTPGAARPFPRG